MPRDIIKQEADAKGEEKKLSHVDESGKAAMVDVGAKPEVFRIARAAGFIRLSPGTIEKIRENSIKKGDVLTVAQIAGIQGAKHTSNLVPLCHPLQVHKIDVDTKITDQGVEVFSEVHCIGKTGVEMEALTAVQIALLTVYDMCKAVDSSMVMENIRLLEKRKEPLQ